MLYPPDGIFTMSSDAPFTCTRCTSTSPLKSAARPRYILTPFALTDLRGPSLSRPLTYGSFMSLYVDIRRQEVEDKRFHPHVVTGGLVRLLKRIRHDLSGDVRAPGEKVYAHHEQYRRKGYVYDPSLHLPPPETAPTRVFLIQAILSLSSTLSLKMSVT